MTVKIGKYEYEKSDRKNKKLNVLVNGKTIHFGDTRYEHFKDKTGIWSALDHNDEKRRRNYRARASKIKNKKGELVFKNPMSPAYHSYNILW